MSIQNPITTFLENEAIEIFRETFANFQNPFLLYSIGKDSSVLLHLAKKAFYPMRMPFTLLHIDTNWKFKEMLTFRDRIVQQGDFRLVVHKNQHAISSGISPFTVGISEYTRMMKTEALREALDIYGVDAAIGGSRRDEERSRAKERIFSLRDVGHRWDPRNQRPEMWTTYNCKILPKQTMRVFPLSNWTEIDIWNYILQEQIEVNPLYFSKSRPTVKRGNQLIMVDDERFPILPDDKIQYKNIRFRTLGCYPLTAAAESMALTVVDICNEITKVKLSERSSRLIDGENEDSMEKKKTEGYF